jgi:iron-sulfur cluster assembly accessory protein
MLPPRTLAGLLMLLATPASAFVVVPDRSACGAQATQALVADAQHINPAAWMMGTLHASSSSEANLPADASIEDDVDDDDTNEDDDDMVIHIKTKAMERLRELKSKQEDPSAPMILRMGVRSGGCSGMSYVMDFTTEDDVNEDDEIDEYSEDGIKCVVDAKSLLFLYGLELDYSDELIGGGFKFFNPNAEEECGCGSSFGV